MRHKLMVTRIAVLAVLGALVLVLATTVSAAPRSTQQQPTPVRVADLPLWLAAPDYLARDLGFYKQQGLDVTITSLASPTLALAGLSSGQFDIFGTCGVASAAAAYVGGVHLKMIAPVGANTPGLMKVLVKSDSSIRSRKDLAGKTVGLTSTGGSAQLINMMWLQQSGVDPTKVSYVALPSASIPSAILQGRIDAGQVPQPALGPALKSGDFRSLGEDIVGLGPYGTLTSGFCASDSFINSNPDAVKRFVKAILQANAYANTHKSRARAELAVYGGLTPDQAQTTPVGTWPSFLPLKSMQKQIDNMVKFGLLSKSFNIRDMVWSGAPTKNR